MTFGNSHKKKTTEAPQTEQLYSNTVLVGNWFEERFSRHTDDHAITPCIYGSSSCLEDRTVYKESYRPLTKECVRHDIIQSFIDWKNEAFSNKAKSAEPNLKFVDSVKFMNNMTTTNDVVYSILPKLPYTKYARIGLTENFGNHTNFGLRKYKKKEKALYDKMPTDVSEYKLNFKPYKVQDMTRERRAPKKAVWNVSSIKCD